MKLLNIKHSLFSNSLRKKNKNNFFYFTAQDMELEIEGKNFVCVYNNFHTNLDGRVKFAPDLN